ncbi:uncharacterized protein MONOS_7869 [Monocercomonoides exilis]|uniref:uncharacterized protein n=1 Tax=Monocercomonoides exilis TaxID=2049356 RepID=UPI00355ABA8D|nr:hypothetical protein MONOS_7869 [Monocercomonoides exilis]|eukprot:MONOS_7869.1-p1 / transcript=MONOS_7869.1 / gene=MONOS_7869 / organism=Monocercomonoides_exilis_PA203 / gene_product=unspecified product / transcript_product=unspecified product / location=Mono_scaffold00281:5224-5984(-) / protein_length=194 / sequence_SO=supercontig / SO=protein_coding / is_pseudo=false
MLFTGEQVSLKFYTVQSFFWVYIYFTFAVSYGRQKTTNSELPLFEDEQKLNERDYFTYVIGILGIAGGGTAMAGFWIFLFGYFKHLGLSGWFIFWFCFTPHGMSFIFILIDQVIFSRTQYKIAHCLIPFAMIFLYLGFAMLHYSIKKKYIYPFLEVSKGNYWIAWIVLAIFPSVLVAIVWLLQIIRGKIVKST